MLDKCGSCHRTTQVDKVFPYGHCKRCSIVFKRKSKSSSIEVLGMLLIDLLDGCSGLFLWIAWLFLILGARPDIHKMMWLFFWSWLGIVILFATFRALR